MEYLMDTLPICSAKSKQSGERCKNFATKGKKVCRIHGGRSTGAKTPEGKLRQLKAKLKHGFYSEYEREERRSMRKMIRDSKELISSVR